MPIEIAVGMILHPTRDCHQHTEGHVSGESRLGKKAFATRLRILDAAAHQFRINGYAGTRMSDVAAELGTQAGSLYYHFSSREELVEEVLRVAQERTIGYVRRRVASLPEDATALDRLREASAAHLATALEIGDYTAAGLRILTQVPERRIHQQREYSEYWRTLIEDARSTGQIRSDLPTSTVQRFMLGAMNSTPEWYRPHRSGLSTTEMADHFSVVFFDGLATTSKPIRRRSVSAAVEAGISATMEIRRDAAVSPGARRILDAAAVVFREKGYSGTRLVDIAAAADVQIGTLYHHFTSREDLVTHLLLSAWAKTSDVVRESVRAVPDDASALERFATAATAHLLSVLESSVYTSALVRIVGQVPAGVRNNTALQRREYMNCWRSLIQQAANSGELPSDLNPTAVIMLMTGALNWAVDWYRPGGELTPLELASVFTTLTFDGLITDGARPGREPRS